MVTRVYVKYCGFTLIELLVVISIIALLISILMPALGVARREAQLIQSLSNLRQIGIASNAYSTEHKENVPIKSNNNGFEVCSWSFGGKFASSFWRTKYLGVYDLAPNTRPLNKYLYPGQLHPPVTGPQDIEGFRRPANESERTDIELPVFESPRDIATMQRRWPYSSPEISSYDDIGTSYHSNFKWYYQLYNRNYGVSPFPPIVEIGREYLRKQQYIETSRFVLYHDQVLDVIRTRSFAYGQIVVDGEYGRENHSAMVFFDGHASFEEAVSNADSGANYDLVFDLP